MSLRIRKNPLNQNVAEITIFQVLPGSPADKAGLEALTSIQKIDGRPVRDFLASFRKGSDLNRKLMGRKLGDQITLEVLTPGSPLGKVVTLTEGRLRSTLGSDVMGPGAGWPSIGR